MINILTTTGYIVGIVEDDIGSYTVTFPEMTLINPDFPQITINYQLTDGGFTKTSFPSEFVDEVPCPRYAIRFLLNLDINQEIREIGLSHRISSILNLDGGLVEEIPISYSEFELAQESMLVSLFFDSMSKNFDKKTFKEAKKLGILDGYEVAVEMWNNYNEDYS